MSDPNSAIIQHIEALVAEAAQLAVKRHLSLGHSVPYWDRQSNQVMYQHPDGTRTAERAPSANDPKLG